MRAFVVSVGFSDFLAVTLKKNRHHFEQYHIITSKEDYKNVIPIADEYGAAVYATDIFYEGEGVKFAKWAGLEAGLDHFGRHGWITLLDVDILIPDIIDLEQYLRIGYLYTPYRRMCDPVPQIIPSESEWRQWPVHRQEREWAGYFQCFHGGLDPHLGSPPWHTTNWKTAGSSDSFFQAKWPQEFKIRPKFHVLHLGTNGQNWAGRVTPYLDGSIDPKAKERSAYMKEMFRLRRQNRNLDHERF